jgi:hypothetical protein
MEAADSNEILSVRAREQKMLTRHLFAYVVCLHYTLAYIFLIVIGLRAEKMLSDPITSFIRKINHRGNKQLFINGFQLNHRPSDLDALRSREMLFLLYSNNNYCSYYSCFFFLLMLEKSKSGQSIKKFLPNPWQCFAHI